MDYTSLGKTGLKVSRICLGCMTYGVPDRGASTRGRWMKSWPAGPFIQRAFELGINFFDTANVYSDGTSEEILGRAIKAFAKRRKKSSSPPRSTAECDKTQTAPASRARRSWPRSTPA